ncbi:MAG: hypothetical protein KatS3mg065_0659 [Chloroflexota bacterium]|nr:MAG: hypothetical protein KatS3mg065_0659 [Chloroflexota bacterium]
MGFGRLIRKSAIALAAVSFAVLACGAGGPEGSSPDGSPRPTYRQSGVGSSSSPWASCLQEKGYPARVDGQACGVHQVDGVTDDPTKLRAESRACVEAVDPARLLPPPPLTSEQLLAFYRYVVAETDCMRQAGYPVSDPPPFQVWVDSDRAFDPFADLRTRGIDFDHADLVRCQAVPERPTFLDE